MTKCGRFSTITFDHRVKKITELLDKKVGPSSGCNFPFNYSKLEKQVIKYVKLEDDEAEREGRNRI